MKTGSLRRFQQYPTINMQVSSQHLLLWIVIIQDKPQSIVKKPDLKLPLKVVEFSWNRLGEMSFLAGTKPLMAELANHH